MNLRFASVEQNGATHGHLPDGDASPSAQAKPDSSGQRNTNDELSNDRNQGVPQLNLIIAVDAIVSFRSFMTDSPSFLLAAGAAIALFAAKKVLDRFDLMDKICNRTYIYNICWEDPAVDHQVLNITHDDVIFRICSAGDIVLDYAIEGPSKIVVCDMNLHQLWLFELKIRMLRDPKLTYEEWWGIWGDSDVETALKVWKRMRHTMSADGRKWWDGRMERVFRQGFATTGSTGFDREGHASAFSCG
ncbi:hypothetical protein THAOC_24500 [Thalassiosira oceanica]|uniref:Uncharacterized protein n=1 Tax=Thalassiosira oceanica TaxID=159749 RepID=K0RRW4_THAOC|nr:hypothetical protein THAOC_24500 [Thalassiosira oceanica]|eukprot:EJK55735.1 hypothetical protein THAOC_24500 [Thalassiosira oceanica]